MFDDDGGMPEEMGAQAIIVSSLPGNMMPVVNIIMEHVDYGKRGNGDAVRSMDEAAGKVDHALGYGMPVLVITTFVEARVW
jgi:hypothetical protein